MVSQIIYSAILGLIFTLCFVSFIITIGSRFWWPLQYIYIKTFQKWSGGDDSKWYDDTVKYIKDGHIIPVLYLDEYVVKKVYQPDDFKDFIKSYPYYILIFPDRDVVLYHNDEIAICSFCNPILLHLMYMNGYSRNVVSETIQRGQKLCKQWDEDRRKRQSQLEQQIKENEEIIEKIKKI